MTYFQWNRVFRSRLNKLLWNVEVSGLIFKKYRCAARQTTSKSVFRAFSDWWALAYHYLSEGAVKSKQSPLSLPVIRENLEKML